MSNIPQDECIRNRFTGHVPIELYRPIVEYVVDRQPLLSLCLTSKDFKFEAERLLYNSMTTPLTENGVTVHAKFLRTVSNVKRLAALVRTYYFSWGNKCYSVPPSPLPSLLRSALQAMVNLRELWLAVVDMHSTAAPGTESIVQMPFIFDNCTFQLDTLLMMHCIDTTAFCSFLAGQKKLRKLTAYLDPYARNRKHILSPEACPSLEVLQGNRNAIDVLLPNCHIKSLMWDPDMFEMNQSLPHLSEALSDLKILSLGGNYLRPSLHTLAEHLKSVEWLELVTIHSGELDVIGSIASLRGLILTDAFSYTTWIHRTSLVLQVFSSCSQLEFVAIQSIVSRSSHQPNLYERWTCPPGSSKPSIEGVEDKEAIYQRFDNDDLLLPH
ncbi:hypothetical protein CPC08DRAFT_756069 [Agrocybe pediades]|nr:hypothetical protein CPC08DRAFT_756069 [Agrocybe pediades]